MAWGGRYETPAWRTWQLRGGGFPAPYSSPLVPPLTDGQQRGTLFSCQSAFPATLSRSVTDDPRNSKNVLGVASPSRSPDVPLRLPEVAPGGGDGEPRQDLPCFTLVRLDRIPGWAWGAAGLKLASLPATVASLRPPEVER